MTITIGIDLGGTVIKIGLMQDGELTDRREIVAQSASGLKSQLPDLESTINAILKSNKIQSKKHGCSKHLMIGRNKLRYWMKKYK